MTELDDNAAVRRVLDGDVDAFALIVERYQRPIRRFVTNMSPRTQAADDIAQDVFLAAYRSLRRFDARRGKLTTWLFAIARNRMINHVQAEARRPPPPELLLDRGTWTDPAAGLEHQEAMAALDAALSQLPGGQRAVFVLAEIEQLPLAEVAAIEGVPVGTVKSRLSRAKEALRAALAKMGVEP